jgi:hypothetical protein
MKKIKTLDQRYDTIAWGALFLYVGILSLISGVPAGTGALGIGAILLGLNLARYLSKIPTNGFSTALGWVMLALGIIVYGMRWLLKIPVDLPFFETLLIVIGAVFLIRGITPR